MRKISLSLILSIIILFSGCATDSLENSKKECIKNNQKFIVIEKMNYRTGLLEPKVKCID